MEDEKDNKIVPRSSSSFYLSPDDIVDNALQNLDEKQVQQVTQKAADEVVKLAIEKRKAEYRNNAAQDELRNLIDNANLLDQRGGDYKINSTFETASGTTNVEIQNSKFDLKTITLIAAGIVILVLLIFLLLRN